VVAKKTSGKQYLKEKEIMFLRNQSLDILRGFSVFLMFLVNFPGSWSFIYSPLQHAKETGITLADIVFPIFLWTVGYSIQITLEKRKGEGNLKFLSHIFFRAIFLVLCGLLLSLFPHWKFDSFRIPGVLQRIGFCYLLVILIFRFFSRTSAIVFTIFLSVMFSLLDRFLLLDEFELQLTSAIIPIEKSMGAVLDRFLFGIHLWKETKIYDPEGLVSSFASILTVMMGILANLWGYKKEKPWRSGFILSFVYFLLGVLLSYPIPIQKMTWSLSYSFLTGGIVQILYVLFQKISLSSKTSRAKEILSFLFSLPGRHALLIFFVSGVIARTKFFASFRSIVFSKLVLLTQDRYFSSFIFSLFLYAILSILLLLGVKTVHWTNHKFKSFSMRRPASFRFDSNVSK